MKKIILSLLSTLFIVALYAQDPAFNFGDPIERPAGQIDVRLLGHTPQGYFSVNKIAPSGAMQFSPTIIVEYINSKQQQVLSHNLTVETMEDYVNVVYFNNTLYLLKALFSKSAGTNVLTAEPIGRDGSGGKAIEIGTLPAEKLAKRGLFYAAASPDGSKLLILSQPEFVKGENEKITITLYGNGGFNKIWHSEQTFPYEWTRAVENTPSVNNNGTAFLLKKTDMKGDDNTFSVFSFDGKALKEHKIALDGKKKVHTIVSAFNNAGDFTVGGYFTEDAKVKLGFGTALHGSFLWQVDPTGANAKVAAINPFEKRKDIIAKSIVFSGDKNILLGEWYYVNSKSASKPGDMFAKDYTYSGNDVIIDGFDAAGKPLYATSIKKRNESVNDNGGMVSYFAAVIKGKLYVIFNDDKYNHDGKKNIIVFGSNKIVVYATVDPVTGAVTETKPVGFTGPVGDKGGDMLLRPDVFIKGDDTHYMIRAENRSGYRMGTVSF